MNCKFLSNGLALSYDHHNQFVNYMTKLDMVKNLYGEDYNIYFKNITKKILT